MKGLRHIPALLAILSLCLLCACGGGGGGGGSSSPARLRPTRHARAVIGYLFAEFSACEQRRRHNGHVQLYRCGR